MNNRKFLASDNGVPFETGYTGITNAGHNIDGVVQGMYLKWIGGSPQIFSTDLGKTNGDEKLRSNYITNLESKSPVHSGGTIMKEVLYAMNDGKYQGSQLADMLELLERDSVRVYAAKKDMSDVKTLDQVMQLPSIQVKLNKHVNDIDIPTLRKLAKSRKTKGYKVTIH